MCVRGRKHTTRGAPPPNCLRSRCQGHDRKEDQGPLPDAEEVPVQANVQEAPAGDPPHEVAANDVGQQVGENAQNENEEGGILQGVADAIGTILQAPQAPFATVAQKYHDLIENDYVPCLEKMEAYRKQRELFDFGEEHDGSDRQFECIRANGLVFRAIELESPEGRSPKMQEA